MRQKPTPFGYIGSFPIPEVIIVTIKPPVITCGGPQKVLNLM